MQEKSFNAVSYRRRVAAMVVLCIATGTSGCGTARDENFDRSALFTQLAGDIDATAPSDVSGIQGEATYSGAALANFGGFSGTADATLTANFEDRTISGSMTSWEDLDPLNYVLRGGIELTNGSIADDGSFTSQMAGNIERDRRGSQLGGSISVREDPLAVPPVLPVVSPVVKVFAGVAEGQFFDSVGGDVASRVVGRFEETLTGNVVSGEFIAGQ